jgi:PAS domain S-box-containing protein
MRPTGVEAMPPSQAASAREDDIALLHRISMALISQHDAKALYEKILDAAVAIVGSDFASLQMLQPERNQLQLLAFRGFNPEAATFWEWVRADSESTCGVALRTGERSIAPDIEHCEFMAGSDDRATYLQTGIRACQTTPLISRAGKVVGMFSTHWNRPHHPSERDLRLLDILARQAADLLERVIGEEALRASEEFNRSLMEGSSDCVKVLDLEGRVLLVNDPGLLLLGMDRPENIIGRDWVKLWPNDMQSAVHRAVEAARSGETCSFDGICPTAKGVTKWWDVSVSPVRDVRGGQIVRLLAVSRDITTRKKAEDLQKLLTGELSHRVKNMLANVQAIATQTFKHSHSPADFVSSFGGRIQSMSRVHSQLSNNEWGGTDLREIVLDQMKLGAGDEARIKMTGPEVSLPSEIVPQIAMMLHELGTNSVKYGALSKEGGEVSIGWLMEGTVLHLLWAERGGPPVRAPIHRGFGSTLIERSAAGAGGTAQLVIEVAGIKWQIALPLPDTATRHDLAEKTTRLDNSSSSAQKNKAQTHVLAGTRVLIVEDEVLVAMEIADHLERAGANIVGTAGNGRDALAIIENQKLDFVLLDANLLGHPVGDIAAALTRENVPFAFVSGYGRDSLPTAFAAAEFLAKPFSAQQLLDLAIRLAGATATIISLDAKRK